MNKYLFFNSMHFHDIRVSFVALKISEESFFSFELLALFLAPLFLKSDAASHVALLAEPPRPPGCESEKRLA